METPEGMKLRLLSAVEELGHKMDHEMDRLLDSAAEPPALYMDKVEEEVYMLSTMSGRKEQFPLSSLCFEPGMRCIQ